MIDPVNLLCWRYLQFLLLGYTYVHRADKDKDFVIAYSEFRFIRVPKELGKSPVRLLNERSLAKSISFEDE